MFHKSVFVKSEEIFTRVDMHTNVYQRVHTYVFQHWKYTAVKP